MNRPVASLAALSAALALAAGCGGGSSSGGGAQSLPQKVGKGEGRLDLIAWQGYTEPDVVKPFEQQTGCQVNVKYAGTSDEMVTLMRSGGGRNYDGVSASGDATNRLIAGGDVAQVNTDLIPDFKDISPALQSPPHNTVDGKHYGVSYQWGANLLMYNTTAVKPKPDSWGVVFDGTSYKGRVTAYDSPIYIADAALYLKATQPGLGIADPYELTSKQLDAAVSLLQKQHAQIGDYWSSFTSEIQDFKQGNIVIGQAWPYQVNALESDGEPIDAVLPKEGATGWADTWMMSSHARHPNCMYRWMAYATSPPAQAKTAKTFGSAPANPKACSILGQQYCDQYHVTDQNYFKHIAFWKTPLPDCGNGKNDCMDYSVWTQKWAEIRG